MLEPTGWHSRGYLPHFDDGRSLQAVTYRLADALPAEVVAKLAEQSIEDDERREEIERFIDAGYGECLLREAENASAVVENWLRFHGLRYHLHAWVVMPNHVHVLIEPINNVALAEVVQSWKSYTAKIILGNGAGRRPALPGKPRVWQADYWDRFIRNERHYRATVEYIHQNPVKAGLVSTGRALAVEQRLLPGSAGGPPASLRLRASGPRSQEEKC